MQNLISGLEANGIHPIDPHKVISYIPQNRTQEEGWNHSFEEFMKGTISETTTKKKREKYLNYFITKYCFAVFLYHCFGTRILLPCEVSI